MLWRLTMRCPWCGVDDDRVVDSRTADTGASIRRRRECVSCSRRFTTYERIEDVGLVVVKRDGSREPWDRDKLEAGIRKSLTGRPVTNIQIDQILDRVEARVRKKGPAVPSSVVQAAGDFERELGLLLEKTEPAKRRKG